MSSKITVHQQKKINSVVQQNNLISKPDKPTDKATQRGRTLTVSRGNPDFCITCGERHSTIACPEFDPVNAIIPTLTTFNPERRDITPKPSKCKSCVIVERGVVVIDGYQITTTKRKLCPTHLLQHPPTEENTSILNLDTPPVPTPSTTPSTTPYLDLLEDMDLDSDPFSVLAPPPEFVDQPPTAPTIPEIPAVPETPAVAQPANGRLTRRTQLKKKTNSVRDIGAIMDEYQSFLIDFSETNSVEDTCSNLKLGRTQFYVKKPIAELQITDDETFTLLKEEAIANGVTLKAFSKLCKEKLKSAPINTTVQNLRKDGKLLPS